MLISALTKIIYFDCALLTHDHALTHSSRYLCYSIRDRPFLRSYLYLSLLFLCIFLLSSTEFLTHWYDRASNTDRWACQTWDPPTTKIEEILISSDGSRNPLRAATASG